VLAAVTRPRTAIGIAGVLLLATPLLLSRREHVRAPPVRRDARMRELWLRWCGRRTGC